MVKVIAVLGALFVASAAATIRYMPFGDSITEIVCWRGYLYQALQSAGYTDVSFVGSNNDENPAGCPIENYDKHNEGHSGYLAINIANQNQLVGWLKANPADVITMHLGTNDVAQGHSTTDIIAAFTTLITQMRAANPNMKIIVAQIIPIATASLNSGNVALNAAIPAWAAAQNTTSSPIWVVDQYTGFPTSDLRDGVHPNSAGDQIMESKWYPALVNAFQLIRGSTTGTTTTTATSSSPTSSSSVATTSPSGGGTVAEWGQCGGSGYAGSTACASPYTCHVLNPYYSQCY